MPHPPDSNLHVLFINPQGQHSYFTYLGLSQSKYSLHILCPPLLLQLLLRRWKNSGLLTLSPGFFEVVFFWPLSLLFFFFYRSHLFSEALYLRFFLYLSRLYLFFNHFDVVYVYQDYCLPLFDHLLSVGTRIFCEVIIDINEKSDNFYSSMKALASASKRIFPSRNMHCVSFFSHTNSIFLPYGGDKLPYLCKSRVPITSFHSCHSVLSVSLLQSSSFVVAVRATSSRKGLDLFLDSLKQFSFSDPDLCSCTYFHICGDLVQPHFKYLAAVLSSYPNINLTFGRLSQPEYLSFLGRCQLFILPSRLEGASPAALEALYSGIPCILSPQCGVDNFVHMRHGLLLNSLSSHALADSLTYVLSSPDLLSRFKSLLSSDKNLFTWTSYLSGIANLLDSSFFD